MKKIGWIVIIALVALIAAYVAYMVTRPSQSPQYSQPPNANANAPVANVPAAAPSVGVKLSSANGAAYLTDSNGMTLYYFVKDVPGKSNCPAGPCLNLWPIFSGETMSVESPLSAADFSVITRPDGASQTAYKGWPLYYFANDKKPGDMLGQGSLGVWFIAPQPFYTVMLENQTAANGTYLSDAAGRALYTFKNDKPATATAPAVSACTGACAANWPAFYAEKVIAPSTVDSSLFASLAKPDGSEQLTYKGMPLYYYAADSAPGDIKGQGFNNLWYVAAP